MKGLQTNLFDQNVLSDICVNLANIKHELYAKHLNQSFFNARLCAFVGSSRNWIVTVVLPITEN